VQLLNKVKHPGMSVRRRELTAFFTVHGFVYASWAVRVPAVKQQTGASADQLGLALLCMSGGAVATMLIAGAACRRFGSTRLTVASCAALALTLLLPPLAHSAAELGGALLIFGAAYGCMNVAMNSVAVDHVAALRRPVMPSFHAAWSVGGLAGASLGGLLAPHLSPLRDLSLICLVALLVTAIAGRGLLRDMSAAPADPAPAARSSRAGWRGTLRSVRVVGVFGLIALCAAYGEGAVGDWGALHLREDLKVSAGLAAAAYAAFALAEATGRLSGTKLLEWHGQTRVVVAGGLTACAGMLVAALAPNVWLALIGFAATGLGLANMFPAAMARAGLLAGPSGVALASTLGYGGLLLGPPTIGFLAADAGLRYALTTVSFLALVAAAIGYLARDT
jgi:MFS family permease